MLLDALHSIVLHGRDLSREEARQTMAQILSGKATDTQIAALLVSLHMKGETVEEIVGFAEAIRAAARTNIDSDGEHAVDVSGTERDALVDTCGTGGGTAGTFNISTVTAFVVAGAGVRVAKHGNRSITSRCGSADVIEALGVNLILPPSRLKQCLQEVGIAFFFAPMVHSATKYVQPARRELRLPTVFNLLGPLTNPANASAQVVGVYSVSIAEKIARALCMLGVNRAFVVHGKDGLDEITVTAPTLVAEVREGNVHTYEIAPEDFGLTRAPLASIMGGDVQENAQIVRALLHSEFPDPSYHAKRDVVLLNSAAALAAAGVAKTIADALPIARHSLESGAAREKLERLAAFR
ncbi:MAG: anthranilate phosphoribosyltransferase [Acidobacteriales bacterium]|nr:anthranilate phosphoribosyltransferase [Terriglobales bacterium]